MKPEAVAWVAVLVTRPGRTSWGQRAGMLLQCQREGGFVGWARLGWVAETPRW